MIRDLVPAMAFSLMAVAALAEPQPLPTVFVPAPMERQSSLADAERLMSEADDLFSRGRLEQARALWSNVAEDHSKSSHAPTALLRLAETEADLFRALRGAEEIIAEHPQSPEVEQARLLQGEVFHLLGDYTSAAEVYADYLTHHPRGEAVGLARSRLITGLIESGQAEEALAEWDLQYENDRSMGSDLTSLMQRADALIALEHWDEAADLLRLVTSRFPNRDQTPRAHLAAGLCLESLDRWGEAAVVYGMLARQWPQSTEGRLAQERLDAIARFQRALAQMR